jgi:hypothetical protein
MIPQIEADYADDLGIDVFSLVNFSTIINLHFDVELSSQILKIVRVIPPNPRNPGSVI